MTQSHGNMGEKVLVAIGIAKQRNAVLVQLPDESRKKFIVANKLSDYQEFSTYLKSLRLPCMVGLEATGNYHRPLAYYLHQEGFELKLISSVAAARTREAMYNSWDKNDPKYCGLNLSTQQSGSFRGMSKLSKFGNARLRCAFWMAGTVAIRMHENTFRKKYENYIKADPRNPDLKRKAYTAVAAKMARVSYGLIKSEKDYRGFFESSIPSGKIPSVEPLRHL